jgi:hypothetical protein
MKKMTDRKPREARIYYEIETCKESEVKELEAYTTELEQRIEAMKCCGNCANAVNNICTISNPCNWQIKEGE